MCENGLLDHPRFRGLLQPFAPCDDGPARCSLGSKRWAVRATATFPSRVGRTG